MKYTVYIQGFNEDDTINDYDEPIAEFVDEDKAIWFAENYPFNAPLLTPHAKVIVEEREDNGEFVDVVLESEIS